MMTQFLHWGALSDHIHMSLQRSLGWSLQWPPRLVPWLSSWFFFFQIPSNHGNLYPILRLNHAKSLSPNLAFPGLNMMATIRPHWRSEGANVGVGQPFNLVQFFLLWLGWCTCNYYHRSLQLHFVANGVWSIDRIPCYTCNIHPFC